MVAYRRKLVLLAAALAAWVPCGPARAGNVELSVSAREVYVGVPFVVDVVISDARTYDPPTFPEIPGVQGSRRATSTSTETQIFGGRATSKVRLSYEFTAEREGQITIPSIPVTVDGQEQRTGPAQIVAIPIPQGPAEGTLLFLDVKSPQDTYYLGQTVDLTLEIWLLPYFDDRYTVRYDLQAMLSQINVRSCRWGVFTDYLPRNVHPREILRKDANGTQRAYYVYSIPATFSPHQAGTINLDDIRVVVDYPTRIRRSRSIFDATWETVESRKIAAAVHRDPIVIEQPPLEGRPPAFAGAVGRFGFIVSAKPREVAVGDPITLTLAIDDRSTPATDMAMLQPPPLSDDPALTSGFRVASDPPAGVVEGRRKTFTQTIRATSDAVDAVPPIAFSFFDPDSHRYVTVSSEPISLRVQPATLLSDAQIVGGDGSPARAATELDEVAGGILANYTGTDLLAPQAFRFTWGHGAALALGPLAFVVVAVGRRRARRLRRDGGHARRRRARREALRRLAEAHGSPDREANLAAAAVSEYVADRCNLPAGALTSAEVVEQLSGGRVAPEIVADIETLLADCEQRRYAGGAGGDANSIADRARRCIDRLERERLK